MVAGTPVTEQDQASAGKGTYGKLDEEKGSNMEMTPVSGTEEKKEEQEYNPKRPIVEAPSDEPKSSNIGPAYVKYWLDKGKDPYDPALLPKVEVMMKIYQISSVDVIANTFDVTFNIMLDWYDPSLPPVSEMKGKDFNPYAHFYLSWLIEGAVGDPEFLGGHNTKPRARQDRGHVTVTNKVKCTMRNKYNVKNFPFDLQYLNIRIVVRSISDGQVWSNGEKSNYPEFSDPCLFRQADGHMMAKDADWLDEWSICGLFGAPVSNHKLNKLNGNGVLEKAPVHDGYTAQITLSRDSNNIVWNLGFAVMFLILLAFTSFFIPIHELADRLSVNLTLVLTLMAFKYVLNDRLPRVPYLCLMDQYVIGAFVELVVQSGGMALAAYFDDIADQDPTHWGSQYALMTDKVVWYFMLASTVLLHLHCAVLYCRAASGCGTPNRLVEVDDDAYHNDAVAVKYPIGGAVEQVLRAKGLEGSELNDVMRLLREIKPTGEKVKADKTQQKELDDKLGALDGGALILTKLGLAGDKKKK